MKIKSLDNFYHKIRKSILLVEGYTEIRHMASIMKACRLKPVPIFKEDYKLQLYKLWFDEFGNSLKILKKKRIEVICGDLSLPKSICTDLYSGLSINKTAKMSKVVHIITGLDEDKKEHYLFITFLGIDNYLRSYMFMYNEWTAVSPLMLGIVKLQNIMRHKDIRYFHELAFKKNNIIPCATASEYVSYCLPPKDFVEMLNKKHDIDLSSIFKEK